MNPAEFCREHLFQRCPILLAWPSSLSSSLACGKGSTPRQFYNPPTWQCYLWTHVLKHSGLLEQPVSLTVSAEPDEVRLLRADRAMTCESDMRRQAPDRIL